MQLTNEKIEVTHQMMESNNMTKGLKYGVPVDVKDPNLGLNWKGLLEMQDDDFDKLEEYFSNKKDTECPKTE